MSIDAEIKENIKKTIQNARNNGTTGMSLKNLFQLTRSPKSSFTLNPSAYRLKFEQIAKSVAKDFLIEE